MFVYKSSFKTSQIDLAILTNSNQYIDYTLNFKSHSLTKWIASKIRSLFEPYLIDRHTDVMVSPLLDDNHPLYLYLMLLRQHLNFRMSAVNIDRAVKRIHYYFTRKTPSRPLFNVVWNRVIQSGQCPWITQQIDYALQNKGNTTAYRIKVSRLTLFYMAVKNYLCLNVKKSKQKILSI